MILLLSVRFFLSTIPRLSGKIKFFLSGYASNVFCIGIVDSRLNPLIKQDNIHFEIMDVSRMRYPDEMFDSVFVYNALSHIEHQWEAIKNECKRVLKQNGKI